MTNKVTRKTLDFVVPILAPLSKSWLRHWLYCLLLLQVYVDDNKQQQRKSIIRRQLQHDQELQMNAKQIKSLKLNPIRAMQDVTISNQFHASSCLPVNPLCAPTKKSTNIGLIVCIV